MSQRPQPDEDPADDAARGDGAPNEADDVAELRERIESLRRKDPAFARHCAPGSEEEIIRRHLRFRQWLRDAQAGSREALFQVVEEYGQILLDIVRKRRKELGMDDNPRHRGWQSSLVFESFESAILKLDQFRGKSPGEFFAWLITICEHNEADRQRAWSAEMRDGAREISWEQGLTDQARQAAEGCDDPTPDELAERAEWDATVSAAVDTLDEPAREAIRLRYWNDWTYEQIGKKLGKGAKAVDGLLRRAQKRLEKLLPRKPR